MKLTTCGNSCEACKAPIHCEGGPCCGIGQGFTHEGCRCKECTAARRVAQYPCGHIGDGRNISAAYLREKLGDAFDEEEYEAYVSV